MFRRLFTFLSVLSLLLCVATVVLWVRSYWAADVAALIDGAGGNFSLGSNWGAVVVGHHDSDLSEQAGEDRRLYRRSYVAHRQGFGLQRWSWLGFASSSVMDDDYFAVPYLGVRHSDGRASRDDGPPGVSPQPSAVPCPSWPLPILRLRPPRLPRPVLRVWGRTRGEGSRMIRRLFTLTSVVSLVLCAGTACCVGVELLGGGGGARERP
jgi:hypothetical protein